jgi:2-haloacid dehalogenase
MLDVSRVTVLSFDCYGTLVDWESGILSALRPLLTPGDQRPPDQQLLELYGRFEREAQGQTPFVDYKMVLGDVARNLAEHLGLAVEPGGETFLADSVGNWPVFPDTVAALRALKSRFKLAIISNVDDALFAQSQEALQVPFDWVVTSQQVGSYKPSAANFHAAMRVMEVTPEQLVHVAQSVYHDIRPAAALGLRTVWVNRPGAASTPAIDCQPDLEVPDLKTLAELWA